MKLLVIFLVLQFFSSCVEGQNAHLTRQESFLSLNLPDSISINVPVFFSGQCAPDGEDINVTISGAIPSSVGPCPCQSGEFTCPSVTYSELPPEIEVEASNGVADTSNDDPSVEANSIVTVDEVPIVPGPVTFTGTCSPDATGSILILVPGAVPNAIGYCDCINSSYSCSGSFASVPSIPEVTATNSEGFNGPSSDSYGPSSITITGPSDLSIGSPTTFTGACSPRNEAGAITISIPGAIPTSAGACDCDSTGNFQCDVTFSALPNLPPLITAQNSQGIGGPTTDTYTPSLNSSVDLTPPGNLTINTPVILVGTCSVDGDNVSVAIAGATPASIGPCPCTSGTFTCPSTTFTQLPATTSLIASNSGANDTENSITDSFIDLTDPGSIDSSTPEILSGSCSPNGTGNVSITLASGFTPATAGACDCISGSFTCPAITFTDIPITPTITATETTGANGPATDSHIPQISPSVDLNPPVLTTGEQINLTGECLPRGQVGAIIISIPGAIPATAGPCDCDANGNFNCPAYFSSLPSTAPSVTATNSSGIGGPATDVEVSTILPEIDLILPALVPADGSGNPIAFNATGTCKTDGATITLTSVDITSPTPPITCACGSSTPGLFDCGPILLDGTGTNGNYPIVNTEINDGVNPVVTDTDQTVIPPKLDILGLTDASGVSITGNIPIDAPLFIEGTCSPAGAVVEIQNAQMTATSVTCPCNTGGTFDCGQVSFSGSDTAIDEPVLSGVATDTAGATASDTYTPRIEPMVTVSPPATCTTGVQTLTGTCFPAGIGTVQVSSTAFAVSPITCDCHTGFYGCDVDINDCSVNPNVTAVVQNSNGDTASAGGTVGGPEVNLELAGPIDVDQPIELKGSCSSETDPTNPASFVEVSSANMSPSPVQCDCYQGAFDCGTVTYIGIGDPTFATNLVDDNGGTANDSDTPLILPTLDINLPPIVSAGSPVILGTSDTCSPDSSVVTYASADMSPGVIVCTCVTGVPDCSSSPVVFDGTGPGGGIPVVNASITDPSGNTYADTDQTSLPSLGINAPTDIVDGIAYNVTGTCSPANTPNGVTISTSALPADFSPTSVTCDCNAQGEYSCGQLTSDGTGANGTTPVFDAQISAGGATASASETGIMLPEVEHTNIASIPIDGSLQNITGTCFPIGSNVTVFSNDMDPAILNCPCDGTGNYSCGTASFSGNGPNGSTPEVTSSIIDTNTGISATDTDSISGPSLNIDPIGSVDINTPFVMTGDCAPDGENVTITSSDISVPSGGSVTCPCSAGSFTCPAVEVDGSGPNGILPQFAGTISDPNSGNSATDTTQTSIDPYIDMDSFGPITATDIITFTGSCGVDGQISVTSQDMNPSSIQCQCINGLMSGCGTATFDGLGPNGGVPEVQALLVDSLGNVASDVENTSLPVKFACGATLLAFGYFEDGSPLDHDSTAPPAGSLKIPLEDTIPGTYEIQLSGPGFMADGGQTSGTGTYTFTLQGGEDSIIVPISYDGTLYGTDLAPGNIYGDSLVPLAISSTQSDPSTINLISGTCDAEVEVLSQARQLLGKTAGKYAEDGSGGLCTKNADDEIYCWSYGATQVTGPQPSGNPAFAAFDFTFEQNWSSQFDIPYVILPTEWHAYVITDSGKLVAWGHGSYQALGLSNPVPNFNAPRYMSENNFEGWDFNNRVVSDMKMDHTDGMALLDNGELWSWGSQDSQGDVIGNGTGAAQLTPQAAWDPDVPGGAQYGKFVSNAIRIAAGGENHCYTSSAGKMFCVGQGNNLGRGPTQTDSNVYLEVLGPGGIGTLGDIGTPKEIEMISWMATVGMCVLIDTSVYCWGNSFADKYPKLMVDTNGDDLDDVIKISAGRQHACAARSNGTVWCWGADNLGQLGDGTISGNSWDTAVQVVGEDYDPITNPTSVLSNAVWVDMGWDISCAMKDNGEVYCWGQGSGTTNQYALGHGGAGNTAIPVLFGGGGTPAGVFFVTYRHDTCVVDANADAYCSGRQSGDNPTNIKAQFTP